MASEESHYREQKQEIVELLKNCDSEMSVNAILEECPSLSRGEVIYALRELTEEGTVRCSPYWEYQIARK